MNYLSRMVLASLASALYTVSFAQGQVVPSTRTCTKGDGNDRCAKCQPKLIVTPEAVVANVGETVTLGIRVPGLSTSGDCAISGKGSVTWSARDEGAFPLYSIPEGDACGAGGTRLLAPASGVFSLVSPPYTQSGDYHVPIHVESNFRFQSDTYLCQVDRTIKVTIRPR